VGEHLLFSLYAQLWLLHCATNLGYSNLRKVKILLDALDRKGKAVSYFALDLSPEELERTLAAVPEGTFQNVKCFGLLGTYDDGLAWLKEPENIRKPKTILSLGSSIGNFERNEAAEFISQFADVLTPMDNMLIGIDACTDPERVYHAYNDREGLTHEFILNGLKRANELLGYEAFGPKDWKVIGKYNKEHDRHEAFVAPVKDVTIEGVVIQAGEEVRIEESWKYNWDQSERLWYDARVSEGAKWVNARGDYGNFVFSSFERSVTNITSTAFCQQPRGLVSYRTCNLCFSPLPLAFRLEQSLDGLGLCDTRHDS